MARLNFWGALQAFVLSAAIGFVPGAFGAAVKVAAVLRTAAQVAALTLISGLFRRDPEGQIQEGGIITSAVTPARWVYGERKVPLQLCGLFDKKTPNGDSYRGLVLAVSEGPIEGITSVLVNGEAFTPGTPETTPDGGLRYRPTLNSGMEHGANYMDLILYGRADGTQGEAIRAFSARAVVEDEPGDIPGGDDREDDDPFVAVEASTGTALATPAIRVEHAAGAIRVRWTNEDSDIDGYEYYVWSSNTASSSDIGIDSVIFRAGEERHAGVIETSTETRADDRGEPVPIHALTTYDVGMRTFRTVGAGRTYSSWVRDSVQTPSLGSPYLPVNTVWTDRHKLTGISYVFVQLRQPKDENYWQSMPRIELVVQGRKFTWPGQTMATYSRNAAAIGYDVLRSIQGFEEDEIDEDTFEASYDTANHELTLTPADQQLLDERGYGEYTSRTHIRYGADITIESTDNMEGVWQSILTSMGQGALYAWAGKWNLEAGEAKDPLRTRIDETDIQSVEFGHPRLQERYNAVRMTLEQSAEHDFDRHALEFVAAELRDDRDFGKTYTRDVGSLTSLADPVAAQRMAAFLLRRGIANLAARVTLRARNDLRWLELRPNDVVEICAPTYGWTLGNEWRARVLSVTMEPDWSVAVDLIEEPKEGSGREIWTDSLVPPDFNRREVGDPTRRNVAPVTGLALDELAYTFDGIIYIFIQATWDAVDTDRSVRLRWRVTAGPAGADFDVGGWTYEPWGRPWIEPAHVGWTYEVQAQRGDPHGGYTSPWSASVTDTVDGDLTPPPEPTGLTATGTFNGYRLSWDDPRRAARGATEAEQRDAHTAPAVRWSVFDSDDPTVVGDADANPPAGSWRGSARDNWWVELTSDTDELRVWIRAIDAAGNASDWVTTTVTPLGAVAGADGEDGMGVEYVFQATAAGDPVPGAPAESRVFDPVTDPGDGWFDGTQGTGFSADKPVLYRARRGVAGTPVRGASPYSSGVTLKDGWTGWTVEQVSHWGQDGVDGQPGSRGLAGHARSITRTVRVASAGAADAATEWFLSGSTANWSGNRVLTFGGITALEEALLSHMPQGALVTVYDDRSNWSDYTLRTVTPITFAGTGATRVATIRIAPVEAIGSPPTTGPIALHFTPAGFDGEDGIGWERVFRVHATSTTPTGPSNGRVYDPATDPNDGFTDGLTGLGATNPWYSFWERKVPGSVARGESPYSSGTTLKPGWTNWRHVATIRGWGRDGSAGIRGLAGFSSVLTRTTLVATLGAADTDTEWHLSGSTATWAGNRTLRIGGIDADEEDRLDRTQVGTILTVYIDDDNWGDYTLRNSVTFSGTAPNRTATILLAPVEGRGEPASVGDTDDDLALHFSPAGTKGIGGATWHFGDDDPLDTLGENGDFYFRTSNATIWFKSGGSWAQQGDLSGADTAIWHYGDDEPDDADGDNGDFYFRTGVDAGEIYQKRNDSWELEVDVDQVEDGTRWYFGGVHPDASNAAQNVQDAPVGSFYLLGISGTATELTFRGDTFPDGAVFERKTADSVTFSNNATGDWEYIADLTGPQGVPGVRGLAGYAYEITRSTRASSAATANTDSEWHLTGSTDNWAGNRNLIIGRVGEEDRGRLSRIDVGALVTVYIDDENWADFTLRAAITFDSNLDATIQLAPDEAIGEPPQTGQMGFHFTPAGDDGDNAPPPPTAVSARITRDNAGVPGGPLFSRLHLVATPPADIDAIIVEHTRLETDSGTIVTSAPQRLTGSTHLGSAFDDRIATDSRLIARWVIRVMAERVISGATYRSGAVQVVAEFAAPTTAPVAPAAPTASVSDNDVTVTLAAAAARATSYNVQIRAGLTGAWTTIRTGGTGLSYLDSDRANGTYYYRFVGINAAGSTNGAVSAAVTVNYTPPTNRVTTPTLSAVGRTNGITLTATVATGMGTIRYQIEWRQNSTGAWAVFRTLDTSRVYNGVCPVGTHQFRVRAQDTRGFGAWSNVVTETVDAPTTDGQPPDAPTLTASGDVESYTLTASDVSDSADGTPEYLFQVLLARTWTTVRTWGTGRTHTGTADPGDYQCRCFARDEDGPSVVSNIETVTVDPPPPQAPEPPTLEALASSAGGNTSVLLNATETGGDPGTSMEVEGFFGQTIGWKDIVQGESITGNIDVDVTSAAQRSVRVGDGVGVWAISFRINNIELATVTLRARLTNTAGTSDWSANLTVTVS